jgi:HD-GYP domain-containing protein (c-di-GMP phosphodiesterase class II)
MSSASDQYAALRRIAGLVDAPGAFTQLAPEAADAVRALLAADGVWLCVRGRRNADLVLRHADGVEPRQALSGDLPIAADPLVEAATLADGPLRIDDYAAHAASEPHLRAQGVRAVLSAPLEAGAQGHGVVIAFRRGGAFADGTETLLAQAAQTLALVLTTHAARRAHGEALAREMLLARAANATAAAPDQDAAMHHTATGAAAVADAVFAAVLLGEGPATRLVAVTGDHLGAPRAGLRALPGTLVRGRPQVYIDALGLLAKLGIRGASPDVRGRLCVLQPIADGTDVFGAVLVLLAADAPDPSIFGSLETLAGNAGGVLRRARLHGEIERAYLSTVTALANALEAKDLQTHEHASATSRLAVAVGTELGLSAPELRDLEFAAVLHDVGKIAIPDEILSRRGPLSDEEWAYVRDHTVIGERILRGIPFLRSAAAAVRSAHERWDGGGYPDGLAAERIPLLARIVFACDTWDVMTSDRPYRDALSADEAERRLEAEAGHQLDPQVVGALLAVVRRRRGAVHRVAA